MGWLNSLERRFGYLAIPGLVRFVAIFSGLAFLLYKVNPQYLELISLDPAAVARGQIWRLITYIFIPATMDLFRLPDWFNAAFYVLFLWWIGGGLEQAWGPFKLTLYFLIGVAGTTVAAFFFGAAFSNLMLTASLFFAFARFYPDVVIYFAYVIPLKIKWIAWFSAVLLMFGFVTGTNSYRIALIVALSNYLIFFGPELINEARHRRGVTKRRERFEVESRGDEEPLHRCAFCGATELTNPNLEFRVASNGEEYCMEHLPQAKTVST
jgi:hypothetical protein